MNVFEIILTRVLTFFVILILSILFLIEFSIEVSLFSLLYLFTGKQFELCYFTRSVVKFFDDRKYIEAVF